MAARTRWGLQPHLSNIVHLPLKDLRKLYPDYTDGTLKGKKSFWKTKVKKGEIPMPPPANHEQDPMQGQLPEAPYKGGRLVSTWPTPAFDREKGEWTAYINHKYEYPANPEDGAEIFEAATPAKISPTKRKRAERLGRSILVFGDSQIGYHRLYDEDGQDYLLPTHSEEALNVIAQLNAQLRPDEIVNLSDMVDLGELGRFDPKSDSFHRTLGPAFQRAHDFYAQLRADNPDAKITEVDSNHNARTQKAMMKRYPEWYGFTLPGEDYPMMSYYRLANLAPLDINWISGYGAAEYVYGEENGPPIVFKHGTHSSSSPGATVRKEAQQNPTVNVVRGHGHSHERITQTDRQGNYLNYIQLGTTCQTTGSVPSYHQGVDDFGRPVHGQENWQQQALFIRDWGDGTYQFDTIDIMRGIAHYMEHTYDGNTEATS